MDRPTIVQLPAKDDMMVGLELLRRQMPHLIEHAALIAQFRRAYFQSLIKEGFTETQALELCKHSIAL